MQKGGWQRRCGCASTVSQPLLSLGATIFILDICIGFYLLSRRYENENGCCAICGCGYRFSRCSDPADLSARGSCEACRRNSDDKGQSGWSSSIRRQHFSGHGREVSKSILYGLYPFGECRAVSPRGAIRRTNGWCNWKN